MIKLLKLLKPYTFIIILVLVLIFLQTLSQLYLPTLMSDIVDIGIVNGDINYIIKMGGLMLLVTAGGALATVLASYFSARIGTGYSKTLRSLVFAKVEGFSLNEFDKVGTSSLINRTTNDITHIQRVVMVMLRMMVRSPMMAIGGIVMSFSKDSRLSLVILVVVPILGIIIYFITRMAGPLFSAMQKKLDRVNLVLRENLIGVRVIRAFNRIKFEKKRFNLANKDLTDTALRVNKLMAVMRPSMMLMLNFTIILVIWAGSIRIDNGYLQVGDLMAFIQYIMHILFSFIMFSMMFVMMPRAIASADRINEVLDIVPEIKEAERAKDISNLKGYLEFENVTFSYPGAEEPVLKNLSFKAEPGKITAIIGSTGSGKSTLLKLIPRFYDVEEGNILVDGVDIRLLTQHDLRSKIGYVPQKAVLFTGTIADNIRYGKEDATDEEIRQAAETAQAMEFISKLEDGFKSIISQGGTNLSGGQKQRLSIARALVKRPEIYLFDDSFSALDFKTDARLRLALEEEIKDSTVIIVTQRIGAVINADQIIVLDEGRIVGSGLHKELLKNCEIYRQIARSQLSEEELA
jgi:ATP-binding cassette subfamily B protein